jgi:tripartite-type tricarboxylate transporter receptor subunit TctC
MKKLMLALAAACCLIASARAGLAQQWPQQPIHIIVAFGPGGGADIIGRILADAMQERLGKPVIVENKPGAATTLAANQVAKAAPDGYTLVVLTSIALSINPTLFKHLNYDPQDLTPISLYVKSPFVLVIDPSLPPKTVSEFAEFARKANPPLSYASIGTGSVQHMSMEIAKRRLGFDATHVPYRSTPQSVTDLMGSHVAASFLEAGLSIPLIKEGKLRALAVSSAQRLPLLPDVPPFAEASGAVDYEGVSWHMLLVPSKTPEPIISRLHAEMKRIMQDPEMRAKIAALGLIPNDSPSIEDMRSYIQSEQQKWGAMVKQLGLEGSQ